MKQYFTVILVLITLHGMAQTNPAPFDLSSGNYSFTGWDTLSPAGSYPNSMKFWTVETAALSDTVMPNGDWPCGYNLQSRSRYKGRNQKGIAMLNTANEQFDNCISGPTANNMFVGIIVAGLNTLNRQNITVNWKGRMHSALNYDTAAPQTRFYAIQCQYRVGQTGPFISFSNPASATYYCNIDSFTYKPQNDSSSFSNTLPVACENQPEVQVRWLYYQHFASGQGARPELGVDDINISSTIISGIPQQRIQAINVMPNPVQHGSIYLGTTVRFTVCDILGNSLTNGWLYADHYNIEGLSAGVYMVRTESGEVRRFIKR